MDIRVLDPNPIYLNKIFRLRFRFSSSYPIGTYIPPLLHRLLYDYTNHLRHRSPRSNIYFEHPRSHSPHPPAYLLQWHHLLGPIGKARLEPRSERRERLHEYPEHVNREHEERTPTWRRRVCAEKYPAAEGYSVRLWGCDSVTLLVLSGSGGGRSITTT